MTDAPEQIWAWPWEVNPNMGEWKTDKSAVLGDTEYIRADLARAQAGALLRQAADDISDYPRVALDGIEAQHYDEQIAYAQQIILAIDLDAQAALDRYVQEAVEKTTRVKPRIIPFHTMGNFGVCVGGRWDGWVMVKHPDGYWVSHHKPDPVDPAISVSFDIRAAIGGE